MAILPAHY